MLTMLFVKTTAGATATNAAPPMVADIGPVALLLFPVFVPVSESDDEPHPTANRTAAVNSTIERRRIGHLEAKVGRQPAPRNRLYGFSPELSSTALRRISVLSPKPSDDDDRR